MRKEVFGVKKRRSSKPTFIDLFAGCGGLSLGLMEAGWKGLFAIEKDKMAFETLKHNMTGKTGKNYFNWPKWLHRNLHEISDFNKQYKKNLLGLRGKVDLVAGGPPCQGFSLAGKRSKRDPRNQLFKEYINFLELVQPSICLIENVPGINIGLGKESSLLNGSSYQSIPIAYSTHIKKRLEEIGYRVVFFNIIRAVDCGVPQYRPRFFIIALKKDLSMHIDEESITGMIKKYQNKILKSLKLRTKPDITVADAISDLSVEKNKLENYEGKSRFKKITYKGPKTKYQKYFHTNRNGSSMNGNPLNSLRLPNHKEMTINRFKNIISNCRPGKSIPKQTLEKLGTNKHSLVLLDANKPSHTLTTLPDDILHYAEPRILTVREYARLQSFPDWFEFKGNYTTGGARRTKECPRYTQVANAVPPLMAEVLGAVLKDVLASKK